MKSPEMPATDESPAQPTPSELERQRLGVNL